MKYYNLIKPLQKYIIPLFSPSTTDQLVHDKQVLSDQIAITSDKLDTVKYDTQLIRKYSEEQSMSMRETLIALEKLLRGLQANDIKRDKDLRVLKEDVDAIGEMIPKVLTISV